MRETYFSVSCRLFYKSLMLVTIVTLVANRKKGWTHRHIRLFMPLWYGQLRD